MDKIIKKVSQLPGLTPENYNDMFTLFVKGMENDFWNDMDSIGVKRPTTVTRVTEYMDKMITYIETLEEQGFAYESNGSVYFDTIEYAERGFELRPLHVYSIDEAHDQDYSSDKKHPHDFALWKKSKPGELSFDSKWGKGRVGWHLECSVMATDVLGDVIDIHSGGIDLIFPHHQNEILQANAHSNNPDHKWVNYFLHSGHLNIDGCKMSKSLKNFITIKDYLKNVGTAQQLRLLFLMHKWDKPLDYNMDTIEGAQWIDKRFQEFYDHLVFTLKDEHVVPDDNNGKHGQFVIYLDELIANIDRALRDNFDTSSVVKYLQASVTEVYKYIESSPFNLQLVEAYFDYFKQITTMFGLSFTRNSENESKSQSQDIDKYIELGIDLREDVRKIVMKYKKQIPKEAMKEFFQVLDGFRDVKLAELGIQLQDRAGDKKTKYVRI